SLRPGTAPPPWRLNFPFTALCRPGAVAVGAVAVGAAVLADSADAGALDSAGGDADEGAEDGAGFAGFRRWAEAYVGGSTAASARDRKSTRLNSSHSPIS